MSQALRKLTGAVSRSNTALVFTNQLREKIGVMFGNPETTPGGRALKFYASVRLDIRRIETIKTGTESVGNRVRVKVVKNKVAPPFRVAEFDVMYGEGISQEGGLLDVGVAMDVVTKTGAWFTFGETRLGQGREASKDFLKAQRGHRRRDRPARSAPRSSEVDAAGRGHRRGRVGCHAGWTVDATLPGLLAVAPRAGRDRCSSCGLFGRWIVLGGRERAETPAQMRLLTRVAAPFETHRHRRVARRARPRRLAAIAAGPAVPRAIQGRRSTGCSCRSCCSSRSCRWCRSCSCRAAGCSRRRWRTPTAAAWSRPRSPGVVAIPSSAPRTSTSWPIVTLVFVLMIAKPF